MKQITLPDFLTADEIARAQELYRELKGTGRFVPAIEREIIAPNMGRINSALKQENHGRYLAYAVEFVLGEIETQKGGA